MVESRASADEIRRLNLGYLAILQSAQKALGTDETAQTFSITHDVVERCASTPFDLLALQISSTSVMVAPRPDIGHALEAGGLANSIRNFNLAFFFALQKASRELGVEETSVRFGVRPEVAEKFSEMPTEELVEFASKTSVMVTPRRIFEELLTAGRDQNRRAEALLRGVAEGAI